MESKAQAQLETRIFYFLFLPFPFILCSLVSDHTIGIVYSWHEIAYLYYGPLTNIASKLDLYFVPFFFSLIFLFFILHTLHCAMPTETTLYFEVLIESSDDCYKHHHKCVSARRSEVGQRIMPHVENASS